MAMKVLKIVLITLVLCSISVLSLSCASKSESAPQNQVVTVQRGDLTVDITASGNLALSLKEDLAFEMAGTVEEILVEEGESVQKGQLLSKLDTSEWDNELTKLELALLDAEINLENAELALEQAEEDTSTSITGDIASKTTDPKEIDILELKVKLAEARLEDAQKALDEARDASPEVTAPFAGFITTVNVEGGDDILKGTVAVTLADPNKFEADILVSEMDIPQVKLGGDASVQVDAMQGMSLPAKVTHISPTATIQSGVVNYKVKVEVQSLETVMQERQQGQGGQQQQMPAMIPADFQLREGLTITVSIIVEQKAGVLLIPNGAITSQKGQSYVQVILPTGATEQRAIQTGISNWQYTEVTGGLSEDEKVIVPQGTTTTPTTQQGPGGEMRFFGP
jgi:RND family efflux transporter MFP subunit